MNDDQISAIMQGGAAGVMGARYVRVENLYVGSIAPSPEKSAGPIPPSPYPGLAYFVPQDASRYFGRDEAILALERAISKRSFTALVGASGSGKSSVVLAGLAPRLDAVGGGVPAISAWEPNPTRTPSPHSPEQSRRSSSRATWSIA